MEISFPFHGESDERWADMYANAELEDKDGTG